MVGIGVLQSFISMRWTVSGCVSKRAPEEGGRGDEVASTPDLGRISDGGVEIGGIAHRALGRQVGELVHGKGGAGDVLRQGNARFVIVAVYANLIGSPPAQPR